MPTVNRIQKREKREGGSRDSVEVWGVESRGDRQLVVLGKVLVGRKCVCAMVLVGESHPHCQPWQLPS